MESSKEENKKSEVSKIDKKDVSTEKNIPSDKTRGLKEKDCKPSYDYMKGLFYGDINYII